jgi:hypothetical protein
MTSVEGGQATAAAGTAADPSKGATAAMATVLRARRANRAATAAARARSTERPPGGQDFRAPGGTTSSFYQGALAARSSPAYAPITG